MFKWPGGPRKTFPEVNKYIYIIYIYNIYISIYLFVYLKVRIFKCSYRNPTVGNREEAMTKLVTVILGADGALEIGVKQPAPWI